jgi:hypothetical protein
MRAATQCTDTRIAGREARGRGIASGRRRKRQSGMTKSRWVIAVVALLVARAAAAQPGTVQIFSGTLFTTGAPERTGAAERYQPDFGFAWLQPTSGFGTVQVDLHAVRGNGDPRLGRGLLAIRDVKRGGLVWSVEFGDTTHTPYLTGYGFSNLFAPPVTFRGGSVSAVGDRTSFTLTAGRVTVFRDMFGADAEALGQTIFTARLTHRLSRRLEMSARAASVRTSDLHEFTFTTASGESAGAGARYAVTPTWRVVADAGMTAYRERGSNRTGHGVSALAGTQWVGANGSLEVDAHRFAPGEFGVFNYVYNDREGLFVNGQYTLFGRLRIDGAWELFRENLQASNELGLNQPLTSGSRERISFRYAVTRRLSFGARLDHGSRRAAPSQYVIGYETDTGSASADLQLSFDRLDVFGRVERRTDLGLAGASVHFTEHDTSANVLYRPAPRVQLTSAFQMSRRHGTDGSGQSFWQASFGGQARLRGQKWFARGEVIKSGNRDFATDFLAPRDGYSVGLNGQLTGRLSVSVDAYIDRSPVRAVRPSSPWASRTLVRLAWTLPTHLGGSGPGVVSTRPPGSPTGRAVVEGMVFVDWNGNGVRDADEEVLPGVTIVLDGLERMTTGPDGAFRFPRQAAGAHRLRADLATVPADYDLPDVSALDFALDRGERRAVAFALRPLGDIDGTVFIDVNASRALDDGDAPLDNAVVVLDGGARTEVSRQGRFRFAGVEMGAHSVRLLIESLPDGSALTGSADVTVEVSRTQREGSATFLVRPDKRPEIRKVFPDRQPRTGGAQAPRWPAQSSTTENLTGKE